MSDDTKVVELSKETDSALHWTPLEMLEHEVQAIKDGTRTADKAFVVFLDNDEYGGFNLGYANAKLDSSNIITLLELTKMHMAAQMGVI